MAGALTGHLRRNSGRTGDCRVGTTQAVQASVGVVWVSSSLARSGSVSEVSPERLDAIAELLPDAAHDAERIRHRQQRNCLLVIDHL